MSDIIMRGTKVYKEWQSLVNELEAENAAMRQYIAKSDKRYIKIISDLQNELSEWVQFTKKWSGDLRTHTDIHKEIDE